MYVGLTLFGFVALLCIVAGGIAMKRRRDYGNSEGKEDDFDFDAYEGFDK